MNNSKIFIYFILLDVTLGTHSDRRTKRIIFGDDTRQNELPYMAQIRYKNNGKSCCGATIISSLHVLTAAHCFLGKNGWDKYNDYEIMLGSIKRNGQGGQVFQIEQIYFSPNFESKFSNSDLSVVKVSEQRQMQLFTKLFHILYLIKLF